jgi:eukaryotic-like serine/threonine-protein kinase
MSAWAVFGYTEERELGRGASGRVVAAVHDASGQEVAIKYLAPRLFRDQAFLDGFRAEADVLRSLDVPQVVRLFDYVEDPGKGAAIVMELVNGISLHQMISREGATSPESALVVLKGSLLGLASAHQLGIVHRDYKPENVLVTGAGDSKLTDFGVAVQAGKKAPAAGTPLYMAPEQWHGSPATPATDIYAATAVFFECLTGKTPFSGRLGQLAMQHETAAVPVAMVEEPLQQLIERGMAKDPRDRPPNAMEFVAELNWVAHRAYGADWEERGRGEAGRRASALLVLLLGGAVAGAAGGSFTASALAGLSRRKKVVIASAAAGVLIAVAGAGTTLALQGNTHNVITTAGGNSPGGSGGGGADGSGSPTQGGTTNPGTGTTPPGSPATSPAGNPGGNPPGNPGGNPGNPGGNPPGNPGGNPGNPAGNPPAGNPASSPPPTPPPPTTTPTTTSTAPAAPRIALSLTGNPGSPAPVGVCNNPSGVSFTVTGTISSDQAATVAYQWSDGTGGSVQVSAGGSVSVTDTVTAGSPPWNSGDTLTVTSPASVSNSINLSTSCIPPVTVANPGDQTASAGFDFSLTVTASGGNGHYSFSSLGIMPPGLSIDSSGVISGTPTDDGTYFVRVIATDTESTPQTAFMQFILTVSTPIL